LEFGLYEAMDEVVSIIEWPEKIDPYIPWNSALSINIEFRGNHRMLTLKGYYDKWRKKLPHV